MHYFAPLKYAALPLILTAAGCVTLDDSARHAAHEREDMLRLEEKINRMNGRIEAIELEHQQVSLQLEQVRRSSTSTASSQNEAIKLRLDDLDRRLKDLNAARETDKQQIVENITKKLTPYLTSSSSRSGVRSVAVQGATHEVQSGETLSQIATAYGLTLNELMRANSLDNPDMIRQGQKLVIPGQ